MVPKFGDYQLMGDSLFVRFAEQLLGYRVRRNQRPRQIGLCRSGQSITGLLRRVKKQRPSGIHDKVICMVGTNSIRRKLNVQCCTKRMNQLVNELLQKGVKELVLCTIPPIPRHYEDRAIWKRLINYNRYIRKFKRWPHMRVCDIYSLYCLNGVDPRTGKTVDFSCFEDRYRGTQRADLIHLNRQGLWKLKERLAQTLLEERNQQV